MSLSLPQSGTPDLYAPKHVSAQDRTRPSGRALGHLTDAWKAVDALERDLPTTLERWTQESLVTARNGIRRAWLALSQLDQDLHAEPSCDRIG